MKYFKSHWYDMGAVVALISFISLFIFWSDLEVLQRLLLANFGIMCLHWFEEFRFPGGFPYFCNAIRFKSATPSYYPLNYRSALAINYSFGLVYFIALLFPSLSWLALGVALFGILECLVHGIYNNIKLKGFFNSGMITSLFGFLPLLLGIISYIVSNDLDSIFDWILAFLYPVALYMLFLKFIIPIVLVDREGKYAFSEVEMQRFFSIHKNYIRS